jgi:hypothetical protein
MEPSVADDEIRAPLPRSNRSGGHDILVYLIGMQAGSYVCADNASMNELSQFMIVAGFAAISLRFIVVRNQWRDENDKAGCCSLQLAYWQMGMG